MGEQGYPLYKRMAGSEMDSVWYSRLSGVLNECQGGVALGGTGAFLNALKLKCTSC